jgi:hypothetical protein
MRNNPSLKGMDAFLRRKPDFAQKPRFLGLSSMQLKPFAMAKSLFLRHFLFENFIQ